MILTTGSRRLRIATFTALYFAQGIPIGLLDIAMPAWMAQQGFSNAQVAGFLAVVGLPWAFKLVAGPFMDRFTYPAMGQRRPWVMAAQTGLLLALLLLTVVDDAVAQLALLTAIGFMVNCFGATQDVAVDGMAIDVLPSMERGRVNAFMAFGQVIGYSVFGALGGWMLATYGLPTTALFAASIIGAILLWVTLTRERSGDQFLPGRSTSLAANLAKDQPKLGSLFKNLLRALMLPMSLIIILSMILERIGGGILNVIGPLFAVNELGIEAQVFSQAYGVLAGIAAVLGLLIGILVDRIGAKAILVSAMLGGSGLVLTFSLLPQQWDNMALVVPAFAALVFFVHATFVGSIALCMTICSVKVAATQFAVYMALSNLGRSMGAGLYASIADQVNYAQAMQIAAVALFLGALAMAAFNVERQRDAIHALDVNNG